MDERFQWYIALVEVVENAGGAFSGTKDLVDLFTAEVPGITDPNNSPIRSSARSPTIPGRHIWTPSSC